MSECVYHPGVKAETECQRCKRPICASDKRTFLAEERERAPNIYLTLCPLCLSMEQEEDSSNSLTIMSLVGIAYLVILVLSIIKGRAVVFGSVLVLVIMGIIVLLLFLIALLGGRRESRIAREDMIRFLKSLKWKTAGNVNVTINELLELPPDKLKERAVNIHHELITYLPDFRLKPALERNRWTLDDLGIMFKYFKKNIVYWSWRTDLSEASKNRAAFTFAYMTAVEHVGKEQAYEIVKNAPPGFVQAEMLPQLFENFS